MGKENGGRRTREVEGEREERPGRLAGRRPGGQAGRQITIH